MSKLVGGAETQKGQPHTCLWWFRIGGLPHPKRSPWRSEGPQPHIGFLSLEYQCWEEELPQHLAVKHSGDSDHPGKTEGCKKSRCPLKGPAHRFYRSQALTLGSSEGTVTQEESETYRERLTCMASVQGLERQLPFSLCKILLLYTAGRWSLSFLC